MKPKAVQVGELNKLPLHYSLCSPKMWLSTLCNGDITLFNNLTLHCLDTLYHYKPEILTIHRGRLDSNISCLML